MRAARRFLRLADSVLLPAAAMDDCRMVPLGARRVWDTPALR